MSKYLHIALDNIFPDARIVDVGVNDGEKIVKHSHPTQKLEETAAVDILHGFLLL